MSDPDALPVLQEKRKSCDCAGWRKILCLIACPEINRQLERDSEAEAKEWFDGLQPDDEAPEGSEPIAEAN